MPQIENSILKVSSRRIYATLRTRRRALTYVRRKRKPDRYFYYISAKHWASNWVRGLNKSSKRLFEDPKTQKLALGAAVKSRRVFSTGTSRPKDLVNYIGRPNKGIIKHFLFAALVCRRPNIPQDKAFFTKALNPFVVYYYFLWLKFDLNFCWLLRPRYSQFMLAGIWF